MLSVRPDNGEDGFSIYHGVNSDRLHVEWRKGPLHQSLLTAEQLGRRAQSEQESERELMIVTRHLGRTMLHAREIWFSAAAFACLMISHAATSAEPLS